MVGFAICLSFLLFTSVYFSGDCNSLVGSEEVGVDNPNDSEEVGMEYTFEEDMLGFENIMDVLRLNPDTEDLQGGGEPITPIFKQTKKWVDGIVYYKISNLFSCNEQCIIHEAMHEMERKTCLNFIEDDQRQDYISILPNKRMCASYVGRHGIEQPLFLAPECAIVVGQVIHELMHAIGFLHENSRKDRDDFITINWDNIPEIHHPQFLKHDLNNVTTYGLPYDYQSVMHYETHAFAYDPTVMTVISKQGQEIGQRKHLSDLDIRRINIHYNCTKKTIGCHDTVSSCTSYQNLQTLCRVSIFSAMCNRTCGCSSRRQIPYVILNYDHCQTPADRCTRWINSHNSNCINLNFRRIQRSACYQSCSICD